MMIQVLPFRSIDLFPDSSLRMEGIHLSSLAPFPNSMHCGNLYRDFFFEHSPVNNIIYRKTSFK